MRSDVLIIPLTSKLEESICKYYDNEEWMDIVRGARGITFVGYWNKVTTIQFESEAYKTYYLLMWS